MSQNITPSAPMAPVATQTVTIHSLMNDQAVKNRFNDLLGKKAAGFISSVISVANTHSLIAAEPKTILSSAVVAATLDLPINPNLGYAYIVPYNDKKTHTVKAQFQMGYKGFVQLAQRSGQYKTINATDVREGELISNDILSGEIKIKALDSNRDKAKVIGYAAYIELLNGFSKTFYMSADEMKAHATKYSQSFRNDKYGTSLWNTDFDSMAKKTVLKLLLSKYGPLTIDMQRAQFFDQSVVSNVDNLDTDAFIMNPRQVDYIDNEDETDEDIPQVPSDNAQYNAAVAAASLDFDSAK